jgi:pimeloyl-ACP methyl ester carboxylesterase
MKWYLLPFYFIDDFWLILRNRCRYYFRREPPVDWNTGNKGDVILIHGVHAQWVSLEKIATAIHKEGYRIHIVKKLGTVTKPVIAATHDVAEYIKGNNLKDVIVIGHSKGGIVAVNLLKDPTVAERIKKVINIAGPIKGSFMAWIFPSTRELLPSSDLIKHYYQGIDTKKIINLYPRIDNDILPNKNLVGDNCVNKQIDIFGHIRIVEARQTIEEIKSHLQ